MKILIAAACLLLILPLAIASMQGTLTITHNDSGKVAFAAVNLTLPLSWTIIETVDEPRNNCTNMSITGLPLLSESDEKLSYTFTPWQEGDSVTYWIEDAFGETIKNAYTTTSKSKKSYTPSTDQPEQAFVFFAEREREGCPTITTKQVVVITNDEATIEECVLPEEETMEEESISSLYVRATYYQDTITLYGNAKTAGDYVLFGEETPREVSLEQGTFSLSITPEIGLNTYGIVPADKARMATFELIDKDAEETPGEAPLENESNSSLAADYTFTPPTNNLTGMVVLEDGKGNATPLLLGLCGVAGLLLAFLRKTKPLRIKNRSAKHHGNTQRQAFQEGHQGESARRLAARLGAL